MRECIVVRSRKSAPSMNLSHPLFTDKDKKCHEDDVAGNQPPKTIAHVRYGH